MPEKTYNPSKLHRELAAANLPIVSVDQYGRAAYARPLTGAEEAEAAKIIATHTADPTPAELRHAAYLAAGITAEALAAALWEQTFEGKSTHAADLQARREAIKQRYPDAETAP